MILPIWPRNVKPKWKQIFIWTLHKEQKNLNHYAYYYHVMLYEDTSLNGSILNSVVVEGTKGAQMVRGRARRWARWWAHWVLWQGYGRVQRRGERVVDVETKLERR